jgi:hypothetical protein
MFMWKCDIAALLVQIGTEKDFEIREMLRARRMAGLDP